MPSTLVHLAVGALVGTALLGERFSPHALAVVLVACAVPDLDSFLFVVWSGAHRTALHTFVLPALLAAGLYWDARLRPASTLRDRFGPNAPFVAGVAVASLVAGGILPDLFANGVNAFWPLHDEFVRVNGRALLSDRRGLVQTFVEFGVDPEGSPARTSENTHYATGVNPNRGSGPDGGDPSRPPERVFPVAVGGWQLMLVVVSAFVVAVRSWQWRARAERGTVAARRER